MRARSLVIALTALLVLLLSSFAAHALTQASAQQNTESRVTAVIHGKLAAPIELGVASFAKATTDSWNQHKSRRDFLRTGGMSLAALLLCTGGLLKGRSLSATADYPGPTYPSMQYPCPDYPFKLGVASGDPAPDGVVLWTRLAPDPLHEGGMAQQHVPVRWELSSDENFSTIVRRGAVLATPEFAHAVHVELEGLEPGRYYWYRFKAGNYISPVGRTKTAPAFDSQVESMSFAFASCQNWEAGYYPAYRWMAQQDLDLVFHLGDYIYQWAPMSGVVRHCNDGGLKTLSDYRNRHALYKTDPDLQAAHAAHPWVVTWDNHDGWSNYATLCEDGQKNAARYALRVAYQAYYEHMPLRSLSRPQGPNWRLYRRINYGNLASFSVLDTRTYRTLPCSYGTDSRPSAALEEACTMTGAEQERWLLRALSSPSTRWNVIAQQGMMAQVNQGTGSDEAYNLDAWDGYVAQRKRILDCVRECGTPNPVVISGDMHTSWVSDLKADFDDPSSPTIGAEFVGTSISSNCPTSTIETYKSALGKNNPHVKYFDTRKGGYVRCELTPKQWRSDLQVADSVEDRYSPVRTIASFAVEAGHPGVQGGLTLQGMTSSGRSQAHRKKHHKEKHHGSGQSAAGGGSHPSG